ncbi:MAG: VOC family protein [Acidobacteriota bacterium]
MPRVVHFEIAIDNPKRAIQFYTSVFGWKIEKWQGPMEYWLVTTGQAPEPGIDGALLPRGFYPEPTVNTIAVPSVDEYEAKIKAAGGKIVRSKTAIPGVGYFAICQDSEGNTIGIMHDDPTAK